MGRGIVAALVAALGVGLVVGLPPTRATAAPVEAQGYVELSDGVGLRYTLLLPEGADGPVPIALQYSGYNPGNDAFDRSLTTFGPMLLERGIGVIGVSMRGTGCSEGTFHPFSEDWGDDGAEVVDWIGEQPWSTGDVAMLGTSYPALAAYATASRRPEHLRAIVPMVPLADVYRDVAWPGGMFNASFAYAWTLIQKYGTAFALQEVAEGDTRCAAAVPTQNDPTDVTGVVGQTNPHVDSLDRYTDFLNPDRLARIHVPVLTHTAWQDEQLGSRPTYAYDHLADDSTWVVVSNGTHGGFERNDWFATLVVDFLDHVLRHGDAHGFDAPRVQVVQEVADDQSHRDVDTYDDWPVPTEPLALYADAGGTLGLDPPTAAGSLSYPTPLPSPGWFVEFGLLPQPIADDNYKLPVPEDGRVRLTTPPLAEDLEVLGPGSVDLWLSSTLTDTDLQVSLVEVRPDGQELYVQRGWLRASHRAEDPAWSTPTRPYHRHTSDSVAPLEPGRVTPLRVELWPVGHVFRAGSALRLYVEAPVGPTGFRQFEVLPTPGRNTVHVGPHTPTRLVLSRVAGSEGAPGPMPACDSLANQACRPSPAPPPPGGLVLAGDGRDDRDPGAVSPPAAARRLDRAPLPTTGGGAGAALLVLAAAGAIRARRLR